MESTLNLPKSKAFDPGESATIQAKKLSVALEDQLKSKVPKPSLVGVGLFKVDPRTCSLANWPRTSENSVNLGMEDKWKLDCSEQYDLARAYCTELVGISGVLGYLNSICDDLT